MPKFKANQSPAAIRRTPKFCAQCSFELKLTFIAEENQKRLFCSQCGHIAYLNPFVVAGAIPEDRGKVLLLRRGIEPMKHFWTFPAGFVELGESVLNGAIRETLEETGAKIKIKDLLGVYSYSDHITVNVIYRAKVTGGTLRTCPESEEVRWFPKSKIPWRELAFRSTQEALADWVKGR